MAPVDRRSLEPGVPWLELGEYHDSWTLSPDRRMAAFGISAPGETARIGVRVVDLGTLRTFRDLEVGIVAESVGWIAPDRLVAYLQSGEVVVVDPLSGQELARQALGATNCPVSAVAPAGFVMLIAVGGAARLVLIDAAGRVQTRDLREIAAGPRRGFGLRVHDLSGRLRYTLLAGERVGDVLVAGARAYARTTGGLRVIELRRGRMVARIGRTRGSVDLLHPR